MYYTFGNMSLWLVCVVCIFGVSNSSNFTKQGTTRCGLKNTTGTIVQGSHVHDIDLYFFALTEEYNRITISTCNSTFDTWLYLYDRNLTLLYDCDDCGNCDVKSVVTLRNLTAGDYYIGVGGCCSGLSDWGNYTLEVECDNITPTTTTSYFTTGSSIYYNITEVVGSINCGNELYGTTDEPYDINIYSFNLTQEYLIIKLDTCGSKFDTYLYLYDSNGKLIYSCDDCGNCGTRAVVKLYNYLNTGNYYIGVGGYSDYYGNYTLSVECYNTTIETTSKPYTTSMDVTLYEDWECNHFGAYSLPIPCVFYGEFGITAECIDEDTVLLNYYGSPDCSGDVSVSYTINSTQDNFIFSCSYNDPCDYVAYSIYKNTNDNNCTSDIDHNSDNLLATISSVVNECYSDTITSYEYSCQNNGDIAVIYYDCPHCDNDCLVDEDMYNVYNDFQGSDFCVNFECNEISYTTNPQESGSMDMSNFIVLSLNKMVLVLLAYFVV